MAESQATFAASLLVAAALTATVATSAIISAMPAR